MTEPNKNPDPFKRLKTPGKIALILAMAERRPDFKTGNEFRESVNFLANGKLNHGGKWNEAIFAIAQGIFELPEELKAKVKACLPNARGEIDRGLRKFMTEEGGSDE
ncbi:hypothetical protein N9Z83_01585 [Akkermansiaceae bacterium]|nr:hypothetical protein [Akkermansiaceae bacterium]